MTTTTHWTESVTLSDIELLLCEAKSELKTELLFYSDCKKSNLIVYNLNRKLLMQPQVTLN